ncbi:ribosome maturation factor RimM [Desulfonema magnum]|uniref:ribosome maturation factor RimM n=1 Tax=Desulfonema magnum TaxID=45655 RepID=UPI001A9B5E8D|nr:ribosome maturation factor RimM [Desulfonema magnum]
MKKDGFFTIGKIVGCHGVKGTMKVYSYAESPSVFIPGQPMLLKLPGGEKKTYVLKWIRPHKRTILMCLKGINDRTRAEPLIHSELLMERGALPVLEEGTFYWSDLIGLSVFKTDETYIGRIDSVIQTGSNDVYVVKEKDNEILVPALEWVVIAVDLENKTMRVNLPEGL